MKKIIVAIMALAFSAAISAQMDNEKFVKAMEKNIALADSAKSAQDWIDVTAAFERIADAEKTQWLPYYYAALTQVNMGLMSSQDGKPADAAKIDAIADKAEALISCRSRWRIWTRPAWRPRSRR